MTIAHTRSKMEPWAVETVTELLDQRPVAARIRFSTSTNIAQVDIYRRETFSPVLEWQLEHRGWRFAGAYEGLPDGVIGHYYRHHSVNRQRLRRTRETMMRFMEKIMPTAEAVTLPHAPAELPPPHEPPKPVKIEKSVLRPYYGMRVRVNNTMPYGFHGRTGEVISFPKTWGDRNRQWLKVVFDDCRTHAVIWHRDYFDPI